MSIYVTIRQTLGPSLYFLSKYVEVNKQHRYKKQGLRQSRLQLEPLCQRVSERSTGYVVFAPLILGSDSLCRHYWAVVLRVQRRFFKLLRSPGIDSARRCSLAGRYDNLIPSRFLAHIDCSKILCTRGEDAKRHKTVYISVNNNTKFKIFQILSIYTIWD